MDSHACHNTPRKDKELGSSLYVPLAHHRSTHCCTVYILGHAYYWSQSDHMPLQAIARAYTSLVRALTVKFCSWHVGHQSANRWLKQLLCNSRASRLLCWLLSSGRYVVVMKIKEIKHKELPSARCKEWRDPAYQHQVRQSRLLPVEVLLGLQVTVFSLDELLNPKKRGTKGSEAQNYMNMSKLHSMRMACGLIVLVSWTGIGLQCTLLCLWLYAECELSEFHCCLLWHIVCVCVCVCVCER